MLSKVIRVTAERFRFIYLSTNSVPVGAARVMFADIRFDFERNTFMPTATKVDIYRQFRSEYITPRNPSLVDIKPARYLTIIGRGEPGGAAFEAAIGALYNVAFTVKMARKFAGQDYTVCKLEGLWWGDVSTQCFADQPRETWNWKLMIRVPNFVGESEMKAAIEKLLAKGKPREIGEVKLEPFDEGTCLQVLHVGPYDQESATMVRLHAFAEQNGLEFHGLHHEIYLSDPRRVAPAKLRTILRIPVKRKA